MKVGMTGTQIGATDKQMNLFWTVLQEHKATELHHGDCVGADAQAHAVARKLKLKVVIHPPDNPSKRAFCAAHEERLSRPYLIRNLDIIEAVDLLVGLPGGPEKVRSGTWSTIRQARRRGKKVIVIMPDGEVHGQD
jgi:hypothetical protein